MESTIIKKNFTFSSSDEKTTIHAVKWIPQGSPKAVVQLIHGMVEYIERYDDFARFLASNGYLVVGHDHLGHGQSIRSIEDWGYISEDCPARHLIRDIHRLRTEVQREYKELPYYIAGHSMGSYLLRRYLTHKGAGLKGAIIIGTGQESDMVVRSGLMLVRATAKAKGWRYRSEKIQNLTYSNAYKQYDLTRTDVENSWVCSDPEIMKAYYSDPRCNFLFTTSGFEALLSTVLFDNQKRNIDMIPKELPILLTSGEGDPVGNLGKAVKEVYQRYVQAGITDVDCKLYPDMRHAILNEPGKQEVYNNILDWIQRHE